MRHEKKVNKTRPKIKMEKKEARNSSLKMNAFHNDPIQKQKFVEIIKTAYKNNKLVSGDYWCESDQTGCLVGQFGHDGRHAKMSSDMQVPQWFPFLLDDVFESLPNGTRQEFAVDVITAIPTGFSNWKSYYHQFCLFLIEKICKNTDHWTVKKAISNIISLHKNEEKDDKKWLATRLDAAYAARSAAYAENSAAEYAARSAADSVADSADSAAYAADSAADSAAAYAADSVADSAAADSADSAAYYASYKKIAKKIVTLFDEVHNS